ncbi:HNH endonuclease [Pleionea sp. CnH1-48]|uniref:HNH endonuclease n=1 Tax=Pleionea sp. CnH1-48 TaxID=2954494 RepID=UPI0020975D4C|nr:HNH endonuclease [Pleionea sp. CnH1-48]MCO7225283.1 HNH endonuclease [Pleionea sp. CnH1-48]
MPQRAPRGCRKRGCTKLTIERHGYCSEHAHLASWGKWQSERGTSSQRGYGAKWQKLRKEILARDKYLCQICFAVSRIQAAQTVDHITPKARGGTDSPDNLQSLCYPCHDYKTARE